MPFIFLLFIFLAVQPVPSLLAQTPLEELQVEYEYHMTRGFSPHEDKIKKTQMLVELAQKLANLHSVETSIEEITHPYDESIVYSILKITPSTASLVNREALKVQQLYGGIELILSPYSLKRNLASAFFSPKGEVIGVPYDFIYNQISESYLHEFFHLQTQSMLVRGESDFYAGHFELLSGRYLSSSNQHSYFSFSSLDEYKATLYSVELKMQGLYEDYLIHKNAGTNFYTRENEEILASILNQLETGENLSAQVNELCQKSITQIHENNYQIKSKVIELGHQLSKEIYEWNIITDAYTRSDDYRSDITNIPNGSSLSFYSLTDGQSAMLARLEKLTAESALLENRAKLAKEAIGLRIMYADLEKTNIEKLAQLILGQFTEPLTNIKTHEIRCADHFKKL